MSKKIPSFVAASILSLVTMAAAQQAASGGLTSQLLDALALRNIGPAITPGRVADIAVDPKNDSTWYIAVASGGLWKTTNRGISFRPIFDHYGSYSLGCVTVDPTDSKVVWLGTGENEASRSMSFGDGLYKSTDGGEKWLKVGLPNSEHIAKIIIDPKNHDTVYVAAQGPLWAAGGDRGLFKTTDGGTTWKPILQISENTGVSDLLMDPRDSNVLYAASYQRRRNVGVMVGGGPEANIFKSTDGGATWNKLTEGLPEGDKGRISLAMSPQKPDVIYTHIVSGMQNMGVYRSEDAGKTFARVGAQTIQDPQYYGELYCDPHQFDHLWMVDMNVHETLDGGKSWRNTFSGPHVDNHALWLDPKDEKHLLLGNDGGLYESYDDGATWRHFTNMPTIQFYHIGLDNALPFYNIAAGAQDNGSSAGPSRTQYRVGVRNVEWISIGGGDGMQPRMDPQEPDTVYSMSQNGALQRLDKKTGATRGIRPNDPAAGRGRGGGPGGVDNEEEEQMQAQQQAMTEEEMEEAEEAREAEEAAQAAEGAPPAPAGALRWNWNAPFMVSSHDPHRIYLAANRLFKSDNRGDTWNPVSPDLTKHLDRNKIPVMGKVWDNTAVSRNTFTTDLSIITAISESPVNENILVAGTDDGLIQVTEDGGKNWRKTEKLGDLPDTSFVNNVFASHHDANTIYAAINNWQRGDFKPYLIKSTDLGKTWTAITGDLPDRNPTWSICEDPVNRNLLFAGTEFGLYVTVDGGTHWAQLKGGGVPVIAFRDVQIQKRESDLVCGTFGRGIFILDDISPLRTLTPTALQAEATLFPMRRAMQFYELAYVRATPGDFASPNPPDGALVTYFLKTNMGTAGAAPAAAQPTTDAAGGGGEEDANAQEATPARGGRGGAGGAGGGGGRGAGRGGRGGAGGSVPTGVVITVADESGAIVRRLDVPATAGLHRVNWDLRGSPPAAPATAVATATPPTETQPGQPLQTVGTRPGVVGEIVTEPGQTQPAEPARGGAAARGGRGGGRGGFGGAAQAFVNPGKYTLTLGRMNNGAFAQLAPPQTLEVIAAPAPAR